VARIWAVARLPRTLRNRRPTSRPPREGEEVPGQGPPARQRAEGGAESRSNKKAEVIALMKRAKGVTLAEIEEATGCRTHHSGLREHPGQQGRPEDRILEERCRGTQLPHREVANPQCSLPTPLRFTPGRALLRSGNGSGFTLPQRSRGPKHFGNKCFGETG